MNKTTWLAASIAMSLTVGYGARILNGESTVPVAQTASVEPTIVATADGGPVMLPALTVVVKVPAKRRHAVLASSTGEGATATWTHPEIAVVMKVPPKAEVTEFTWTLPELVVVVKVPAKRDAGFAMAGPTSPMARRMVARLRYLNEVRDGAPAVSPEGVRWNADRDQPARRGELNGPAGDRRTAPAARPDNGIEGVLRPVIRDRASAA